MKKFFVVALCALAFVGFESCKSKAKKAAEVAVEHSNLLKDGKYDLFVEEFHFAPVVPAEQIAAEKEVYKKAYKEQVHPVVAAKGGLKKAKVVSETVSDDGKTAQVVLNHEYGNGQVEEVPYDMVLVDDTWKLAENSHLREVWRTQTPEGDPLEIKIKETPHKDVVKEFVDGEHDFVKEIHEDGKEVAAVRFPCLVTFTKPDFEPRFASAKRRFAAKKMPINMIGADDIADIDRARIGLKGSPTQVRRTFVPEQKKGGTVFRDGEWEDNTRSLAQMLVDNAVVVNMQ